MLVCPVCNKVSVTFDPLMYLSLPIPSTTMRTMTVTVLSTDGSTMPAPFTVTVPKYGRFQDLIDALSTKCFLRNEEKLLVAEVFMRVMVSNTAVLLVLRSICHLGFRSKAWPPNHFIMLRVLIFCCRSFLSTMYIMSLLNFFANSFCHIFVGICFLKAWVLKYHNSLCSIYIWMQNMLFRECYANPCVIK